MHEMLSKLCLQALTEAFKAFIYDAGHVSHASCQMYIFKQSLFKQTNNKQTYFFKQSFEQSAWKQT